MCCQSRVRPLSKASCFAFLSFCESYFKPIVRKRGKPGEPSFCFERPTLLSPLTFPSPAALQTHTTYNRIIAQVHLSFLLVSSLKAHAQLPQRRQRVEYTGRQLSNCVVLQPPVIKNHRDGDGIMSCCPFR